MLEYLENIWQHRKYFFTVCDRLIGNLKYFKYIDINSTFHILKVSDKYLKDFALLSENTRITVESYSNIISILDNAILLSVIKSMRYLPSTLARELRRSKLYQNIYISCLYGLTNCLMSFIRPEKSIQLEQEFRILAKQTLQDYGRALLIIPFRYRLSTIIAGPTFIHIMGITCLIVLLEYILKIIISAFVKFVINLAHAIQNMRKNQPEKWTGFKGAYIKFLDDLTMGFYELFESLASPFTSGYELFSQQYKVYMSTEFNKDHTIKPNSQFDGSEYMPHGASSQIIS